MVLCYINNIHSRLTKYHYDSLITSLRIAVDNDGPLDKEFTSYNDIFDAFRLALKFYHFRESNDY